MRAKILIPLMVLFVAGVVFAAEVTTTWLDVYYKYVQVPFEKLRVGMDSLISFADEKGKSSTTMESLKDEFLAANQELKTAADQNSQTAFDEAIDKMRDAVLKFKNEAKAQFTGTMGGGALVRLGQDLTKNKSSFNSLLDEARNLHKERKTQIFDWGVSKGDAAIQKLKDYGKDATQAEAKLNEIKGKRMGFVTSMSDIVSACYGIERISCQNAANFEANCSAKIQSYCTLKDSIITDFSVLRDLVYQAAGLK